MKKLLIELKNATHTIEKLLSISDLSPEARRNYQREVDLHKEVIAEHEQTESELRSILSAINETVTSGVQICEGDTIQKNIVKMIGGER